MSRRDLYRIPIRTSMLQKRSQKRDEPKYRVIKTIKYNACDLKESPAQLYSINMCQLIWTTAMLLRDFGLTFVDFIFCRRMSIEIRCEKSAMNFMNCQLRSQDAHILGVYSPRSLKIFILEARAQRDLEWTRFQDRDQTK